MTKPNEPRAELLPDELLWAAGGHASDVVLTALADGEHAIVPAAVRAHVEGCRTCTSHLGNAVLLSLHAHREIAVMKAEEAAPSRLPLPRLAIVVALVVAAIGLLPNLFEASSEAADAETFATRTAPVLLRGLSTLVHFLFEPGSASALVLTYGSAFFLVAGALVAVRYLPQKKEVSR